VTGDRSSGVPISACPRAFAFERLERADLAATAISARVGITEHCDHAGLGLGLASLSVAEIVEEELRLLQGVGAVRGHSSGGEPVGALPPGVS
jgi:hypothetical protein